ncbi:MULTISPECIES: phosphoribosyltransferase [Shewanella]|uniref:phosphoribosyltransferase n=1 Tax=Shewanella TaxID=22 RepID=UPI000F423DEB|nr:MULTISPECIES: phosphoribosyltransferase [Shewanella]AYV11554.1 hypothetical protein EEY24_00870 [Shewanella algae]
MGIDIIETRGSRLKEVRVNDAHDRLVITDPSKNPVEHDIGLELLITAVFQRKKSKTRKGDGNPLIYALKGLHHFSISEESKLALYEKMATIVSNHYQGKKFDTVAPLPSSKPIALWLATTCCEILHVPIEKNAFFKATNANVLNQLQGVNGGKEVIELRKLLEKAKPNGQFAMKDVDYAQRLHIEPISVNPFYSPAGKILIVDDLVSSGSSLKSAYNSLKNKDPDLEIECLALLGPVT